MLFSDKFFHSCSLCCTGHCSVMKTCSISIVLLILLAVTSQQFTLCCSSVSLAQLRFSIKAVVVSHLHRSLLICKCGASRGPCLPIVPDVQSIRNLHCNISHILKKDFYKIAWLLATWDKAKIQGGAQSKRSDSTNLPSASPAASLLLLSV